MPCGSLAVQVARLEANIAQELLDNEQLAGALQNWLSQMLGMTFSVETSNAWVRGARHKRFEGDPYLRFTGAGVTVVVGVQAGLQLFDYANTGVPVERIEKFATSLVKLAVQERTVAALRAKYRVTKDTYTPLGNASGMRTLELEI